VQRLTVTLACAIAVLWAPLAALGQTQGAGTGSGTGSAGTDVADLPVCGQPAASKSSTVRRQRPGSRNANAANRPGKRRADPRKRAEARRTRRDRRARARRGDARPNAAASSGQEPVRATLTLDQEDQETVTSAAFGRSTDPQPLTLVYRVTGCRVTDEMPLPRSPLPTGPVKTAGARTLPIGAVQIEDVDADGDRYVVHLRVFVSSDKPSDQRATAQPSTTPTPGPSSGEATGSPDGFGTATGGASTRSADATTTATGTASPPAEFSVDPGSYTSFVRLKAEWLRTVATPVTVTRSEDSETWPLGIGILGGVCGFVVFWLLRKIHREDLMVTENWVVWLVAAISIVVGAGTAFFTNYFNQEVWTRDANGVALFTAAFSASTTGVAAGLLTGIYKTTAAASTPTPKPPTTKPPTTKPAATNR
jgi:hypothetical protein